MIVIALAIRIIIIWQPPINLVQYNADDMYYYLKLAQNIYVGHGITFDGIHMTNGFHPFYLLMLIPIMALSLPDKILAVHLSLVLLAIFNILTGIILFRIIKLITKKETFSLFGAFLWLFNPWVIFNVTMGVEAPISVFFISASILYYLTIRKSLLNDSERFMKRAHNKLHKLILLGSLIGISVLSRSDSIFLLVAVILDMLLVSFINTKKKKFTSSLHLLPHAVIIALVILVVMSPWIIWSQVNFGMPMQGSGMALLYSTHHGLTVMQTINSTITSIVYSSYKLSNYFIAVPFIFLIIGLLIGLLLKKRLFKAKKIMNKKAVLIYTLLIISSLTLIISSSLQEARHYPEGLQVAEIQLILGIITFISGFLLGNITDIQVRPFYARLLKQPILIIFPTIVFLFYAAYFWHHQIWYFLSIILFLIILLCMLASVIANSIGKNAAQKLVYTLFIITLTIFAIRFAVLYDEGINPWQIDMYKGALELKEYTNKNDTGAAFNAGIYGYYGDRTIINLDGVVNNDIVVSRKLGIPLITYLNKNNVTFIIDYPCTLGDISNQLTIIKEIGIQKDYLCENSGPVIYKIEYSTK
jgi:hypothetical protein